MIRYYMVLFELKKKTLKCIKMFLKFTFSYYNYAMPDFFTDFFRVCLPNLLAKDSRREDWPENIKKSDKAQNYFRKIYEVSL